MRLYASLTALLAAAFAAELALGPAPLAMGEAFAALFGGGDELARVIVLELRLPRALLAALVGAALGLSGAGLQGLLRNPLAEPGVIGAGPAAALGAVLAFYSGLGAAAVWALPAAGTAGALIAVLLVWKLAGRTADSLAIVLAGVAVASFAGALVMLALNFASNPFAAAEAFFWLMGSVADRGFDHVAMAAPGILAGAALLLLSARALDALTLGEEAARSLGFDLARVGRTVALGVALAVGSATAAAGAVGFVGLVAPHVMRPFVGHRPGALLPAAALAGAILTLAADLVTRMTATATELKLGVVTGLIGAPFFLFLLWDRRRLDP